MLKSGASTKVGFRLFLQLLRVFSASVLVNLALIGAEILFCHPERSRRAKKIGAQSRTSVNCCIVTALQIIRKAFTNSSILSAIKRWKNEDCFSKNMAYILTMQKRVSNCLNTLFCEKYFMLSRNYFCNFIGRNIAMRCFQYTIAIFNQ